MWYKNAGTSFFLFVTVQAFDRQTNEQTGGQTEKHWQPCVALHMQSHSKILYCNKNFKKLLGLKL